jgi:hypothetical protein
MKKRDPENRKTLYWLTILLLLSTLLFLTRGHRDTYYTNAWKREQRAPTVSMPVGEAERHSGFQESEVQKVRGKDYATY